MRMAGRFAERREFQRLELREPICGSFGAVEVSIVDIGILGARLAHAAPFASPEGRLRFGWDGERAELDCGVVRSRSDDAGVLESGVRFFLAIGDSDQTLRRMLASLATREIDRRRSGAVAEEHPEIRTAANGGSAPYQRFVFENDVWHQQPSDSPAQPESGFTLAIGEGGLDEVELKKMCLAWSVADEEGRQLIKLFAELSVSEQMGLPRRKD
jgi:hypothetical protein